MMSDSAAIDLASCPEPTERADPLSILSAQARNRVAELVPVRNARMAATPFTFYRGAAAVMSADLSRTPDSGVYTQLCGDAHLSNLGLFFSPERRMTFDLNDFDETHPGPFEWDVKRLAASFVVAGRNNVFDDKTNLKCARAVAKAYRRSIAHSVTKSTLDCWYARMDVDELVALIGEKLDTSINQRTQKALKKARHRNSEQALSKLCVIDADGKAHIRSEPPLLVPIHELYPDDVADTANERIDERLHAYRGCLQGHVRALLDQFTMVDVARKVVGVGSVGTRAWIALLVGQNLDDPLFLQIKEAQRSVLADYVPAPVTPTRASGWWRGSGCCRRPATSSSAGPVATTRTVSGATSTSASCVTGRDRSSSRRSSPRRCSSTRSCADVPSRRHTHAPRVAVGSPNSWRTTGASSNRSVRSRLPTPTSTTATTLG